jgi:hypothetical protein
MVQISGTKHQVRNNIFHRGQWRLQSQNLILAVVGAQKTIPK